MSIRMEYVRNVHMVTIKGIINVYIYQHNANNITLLNRYVKNVMMDINYNNINVLLVHNQ